MDQTVTEPIRAAGVVLKAKTTGRVLLLHRVDGMGWGWPGGRIEEGEDAAQAAWREVWEETGRRLGDVGAFLMRRQKDDGQGLCDFTTFLAPIDEEFTPVLDGEHDAHMWADPEMALAEGGPDRNAMAIADSAGDAELETPPMLQNQGDGFDEPADDEVLDEDDISDEDAARIMEVVEALDARLSRLEDADADPESDDDQPLDEPEKKATPVYGSAGASELARSLEAGMEAGLQEPHWRPSLRLSHHPTERSSDAAPRASCFWVYAYPAFLRYAAHSAGGYWGGFRRRLGRWLRNFAPRPFGAGS